MVTCTSGCMHEGSQPRLHAQVDRLFDWRAGKDAPIRDALERQPPHVTAEFERRLAASILNLNEQARAALSVGFLACACGCFRVLRDPTDPGACATKPST